ncbi:hypothetical protein ACFW6C_02730 [Streptomyces fungicidicus]|uniref:hypothetical protein n=1 Tax=Streptomyces fungicidicus TaxID=68203 RepID=UPI0036A7216F
MTAEPLGRALNHDKHLTRLTPLSESRHPPLRTARMSEPPVLQRLDEKILMMEVLTRLRRNRTEQVPR